MAQWGSTLETYVYPILGTLPVEAVDTGLVLKVLEPIWTTKTETASRVRGRIEAILDYAKVRGHRAGENPARWKGHLDHILPAKTDVARVRHHASLPYAHMPDFWPKLQAQDGLGARALELCILTATRTGDVLGARWGEIDLTAATWSIPGERMKAGADHRIPLAAPAVVLLRKLAARCRDVSVYTLRCLAWWRVFPHRLLVMPVKVTVSGRGVHGPGTLRFPLLCNRGDAQAGRHQLRFRPGDR